MKITKTASQQKPLYNPRAQAAFRTQHHLNIISSPVPSGSRDEIQFPNKRTSTKNKKQNTNRDPMLGGGCFVFYNQNFPCIFQSSCISSNKNRISKVLAGIVKPHCLLQDSAAKLLMKSEFLFWFCQPPDLCSMHSLDQSSTNQTITCPNSPKPWPATTPAQEPARRNQDSLGGGAEQEGTDTKTQTHTHYLPSYNCMAYDFSTEWSSFLTLSFKKLPT